ncbi:antiviral reverse transcriptase Drt3a [Maribacter sp. CXY002]|uniref:antiviral reverse transcriptase Drt3a n=1 Tax=Maribacter luteocoastalis TaxID=3407671 RepID=UPI003B6789FA
MLDQSFSLENFTKIFEIENRKGNFIKEYYSENFHALSNELKNQRKIIKEYRSKGDIEKEDEYLLKLNEIKKDIEDRKKNELEISLQEYVKNVNDKEFKFVFSKFLHEESGKHVYPTGNDGASFFAMKQLQFNIKRTFKVKQGNRYLISKQLQSLIKDDYPKIILRTDIRGFYESVLQEKLLSMINDNQLLSPKSKTLIKSLLYSYNEITNQLDTPKEERRGIPRGAGISAYLAELFMREIDNKIKRSNNVGYYARYVDDIVIVYVPNWQITEEKYLEEVRKIVEEYGLTLNESADKTKIIDTGKNDLFEIVFLGYIFRIENKKYLGTALSENKKNKYVRRIEKTIDTYLIQKDYSQNEASKLLIHRMNYLTKNTRLHKPKKGLVGIYYSNSLIENDCSDLDFLDSELKRLVDEKLPVALYPKLNIKLKSYSFKDGFINKSFFNINSKRKNISDLRPAPLKELKKLDNNFERVISIWK